MAKYRGQVTAAMLAGLALAPAAAFPENLTARQAQLDELLANDCGACHGLTRQGGLGSPLTVAALKDKDSDGLALTILDGRPGTPMPPWRAFMTPDEALWLVARLKRREGTGTP